MKINLGKNKDLELDLNKITSVMLVGKCGTGKTVEALAELMNRLCK
jgi:hypothetical protein